MLGTAQEAALLECSSRSSGSHRSPRPLGKVSSPSVGSPGSCLLLARASSAPQLPPRSTHPAPFYLADIPIKLSPVSADAQQGPAPLSAGAPSVATSHSLAIRQGGAILRSLSERGPSLLRSKSFGQELTHGGGEHERSVPGHPLNTHHSLEDDARSLLRTHTMPAMEATSVTTPAIGSRGCIRLPALRTLMKVFAGLIVVAVTVAAMVYGKEPMNDLLLWLGQHNNPRGMAIFVAIEAASVTLLIPVVPLIVGAGLVFGFAKGLLCVWAGGALGQLGAFLLSRYILRDCLVSAMQKRFAGWDALDKAIQVEGWKLIILLRISPLVPYNVLNVMLGSSGITFKTFAFFSTVGIIPECMITVYFGTLAGSVANVISGNAGPAGPMKLVVFVFGGIVMLLAALYAGYVTKKAIRRAVARAELAQDIEALHPLAAQMELSSSAAADGVSSSDSGTPVPETAHQRRAEHSGPAPRAQSTLRSSVFGGMPGMAITAPVMVTSQDAEKRL